MKSKRSQRFLRLDYTTALVVSAVMLVLFSVGIALVTLVKTNIQNSNDHTQSLQITNLTYCNGEKLDLFVPQSSKPMPLIIYIHGGGWQYGSKVGGSLDLVKPLVEKNFAVASINYRLSTEAKFPAQIQDVYCAVRYLRKNAGQYNVNTSRIGLVGISAGAHLAALAANASDNSAFTKGAYQEESSAIQAAASLSGLLNLEASDFTEATNVNLSKLLQGTGYTRAQASPTTYLSKGDASQLILFGTKDKTASPSQSTTYYQQAQKTGLNVTLQKVERANHNLEPDWSLSTNPSKEQITNLIARYFKKQLDI